jgi:hypothetical protein
LASLILGGVAVQYGDEASGARIRLDSARLDWEAKRRLARRIVAALNLTSEFSLAELERADEAHEWVQRTIDSLLEVVRG